MHVKQPHHCLKFPITLFIFAFIAYAIKFLYMKFTTTTNSHNTFEIVDLLITKTSLHIKKLTPWANLYIAQQHPITTKIIYWYLVSYFIKLGCKTLIMWQTKPLSLKINKTICHICIQWRKTNKTISVFRLNTMT